MAAAMTFGLAYELWAKMPLETGFAEHEPEAPKKRKLAERTVLMKVVHNIQDHLANGRELGALQEYDLAWEKGEDFVASVWNSLTTPQREEITRIQQANQKAHA